MRNILITAGGTGGHVLPGLSVAESLACRGVETAWVGTQSGIEARLVPEAGLPFFTLPVRALRGKGLLFKGLSLFYLVWGVVTAVVVLLKVRPVLVLGMGGYVSAPCGLAAWLLRIPLVIHEQNSIAGVTNRCLAKLADKVMLGYAHALTEKNKCAYVGNPVRQSIIDIPAPEVRLSQREGALRILVIGGSQGAKALNRIIPSALAMLKGSQGFEVMHQTGQHEVEAVQLAYKRCEINAKALSFIDDMAAQYDWADLVISRAGALTVAEIMAAGVASVLIPYPYAVDDHQTSNALPLLQEKAAVLLPEKALSQQGLADVLKPLDRKILLKMSIAARHLCPSNVTEKIIDVCMSTINGEVRA